MTNDELKTICERCESATPGPWKYENDGTVGGILVRPPAGRPHRHDSAADAEFVAHARTDVPALLAEVARLSALLQCVTGLAENNNHLLQGVVHVLLEAMKAATSAEVDRMSPVYAAAQALMEDFHRSGSRYTGGTGFVLQQALEVAEAKRRAVSPEAAETR